MRPLRRSRSAASSCGGEGAAVALDETGDCALTGFDDIAHGVVFCIDFADAVAQGEAAVIVDDADFVHGGGRGPALRS